MASSDPSVSNALLQFQRAFLAKYAYLPEDQQRARWIKYLSDAQKTAEATKYVAPPAIPQKRHAADHGLVNGPGSKRPTQIVAAPVSTYRNDSISPLEPVTPKGTQSTFHSLPISIPGCQQPDSIPTAHRSNAVMMRQGGFLDVQFIDQMQPISPYNIATNQYMHADSLGATVVGNQINRQVLASAVTPSQAVETELHGAVDYCGEPMVRSTTNDVCEFLNMVQVNSPSPDSTSNKSSPDPIFHYVETDSSLAGGQNISYVSPYSLTHVAELKQSTSQEDSAIASSPHSPSLLHNQRQSQSKPVVDSQRSRMSKRTSEQNALSARPIAPKDGLTARRSPTLSTCEPVLKSIPNADGTTTMKAAIPPSQPRPVKSRTTFCQFCNEHPHGFHGEHELRRHIDRHHTQVRRVWVCRDPTAEQTFLRNCNACRTGKTYGANYNCAAHLRRTHFNPCKNKRGGRKKKSEGRGGMGGGNWPSMEELKDWMYETYEDNSGGRVIAQQFSQESNAIPLYTNGIVPPTEPLPYSEIDLDSDDINIRIESGGMIGADGQFYPHSDIGHWSAWSEMFSAPNASWIPNSMPIMGGFNDLATYPTSHVWQRDTTKSS